MCEASGTVTRNDLVAMIRQLLYSRDCDFGSQLAQSTPAGPVFYVVGWSPIPNEPSIAVISLESMRMIVTA